MPPCSWMPVPATLRRHVRGGGLGHRHRDRRVIDALIERPGGVIGQGFGVLDRDQHVGRLMLDPLIAADRLAKGRPAIWRSRRSCRAPAAPRRTSRRRAPPSPAPRPAPAAPSRSCISPSKAEAGNATLSSRTSHSLRVSSIVGSSVTVSPAVSFGIRNRLTPSSIVLPSRVRAATTSTSARCASPTKSLVPERVKPPSVSRAGRVMPAASQRSVGLGPGERRLRLAGGDPRQPFAALRRRAGLGDRRRRRAARSTRTAPA